MLFDIGHCHSEMIRNNIFYKPNKAVGRHHVGTYFLLVKFSYKNYTKHHDIIPYL